MGVRDESLKEVIACERFLCAAKSHGNGNVEKALRPWLGTKEELPGRRVRSCARDETDARTDGALKKSASNVDYYT